MELKEFIRETLSQIVEGVKEAQVATKESGAVINTLVDERKQANKVSFDVLLTNTENEGNKAGIGVFLSAFSMGGNVENQKGNTTHTKVSFDVYVAFPFVENKKDSGLPKFDLHQSK